MGITRPTVVLTVLGVSLIRALRERRARLRVARTDDLEYRLQPGQDPAMILAGLGVAGFEARVETDQGQQSVVVVCDPVRDREPVRTVVRENTTRPDGRPGHPAVVGFTDE